jgi:hypothetical protein
MHFKIANYDYGSLINLDIIFPLSWSIKPNVEHV